MGDKELTDIVRRVKEYGDDAYKEGFKDGVNQGISQGYQRRQIELEQGTTDAPHGPGWDKLKDQEG